MQPTISCHICWSIFHVRLTVFLLAITKIVSPNIEGKVEALQQQGTLDLSTEFSIPDCRCYIFTSHDDPKPGTSFSTGKQHEGVRSLETSLI